MASCPVCGKEADPRNDYRPFCSKRCKDVDLGKWLNEDYRISRPMTVDEHQKAEAEAEEEAEELES